MCALLIGGQYSLSFVSGIEVVSLLLACFSFVFGIRCAILCALSFSVLRNLIFPFSYTAFILYLIYYPLFAFTFASLKKSDDKIQVFPTYLFWALNFIMIAICTTCILLHVFDVIALSRIYKVTLLILLRVIFAILVICIVCFNTLFILHRAKKIKAQSLKIILFGVVGLCFTICFTLLDDIITPLFYGYSKEAALGYFYVSFTALLPHSICVFLSITALFLPIVKVMKRASNVL